MTIRQTISRHPILTGTLGIAGVLALVWLYLFIGISFWGGPIDGRVIDVESDLPLADAYVVARWQKSSFGIAHSSSSCIHVETAISDKDGRYFIPRWWQFPPLLWIDGLTGMDAYRPGYQSVASYTAEARRHPEYVYMKKFVGTDVERFNYISGGVFSGMSCAGAGASRRNMFPLEKGAIQEAKGLVRSEEQRKSVEGMRAVAADDWLAATSNYGETFLRPLENLSADVRKELE